MAVPLRRGDKGTFESRFTKKVLSPTLEAAAAGECTVLFVSLDKGFPGGACSRVGVTGLRIILEVRLRLCSVVGLAWQITFAGESSCFATALIGWRPVLEAALLPSPRLNVAAGIAGTW